MSMWGSRFAFLVNVLNFVFFHPQPWSPTFVFTDPLCVAPEAGFTHSSVNGRINNNSPAKIAFPGWVSLALAAGAAAARLRAPTEGPITLPWSCMITNLLLSLFSLSGGLCSLQSGPERSAQARVRGWCLFRTRTEVPAAPSVDSERTSDARQGTSECSMWRRLCLVTMATLCRDSREDDVAWGRAAPGTHGRFQQRTTSVALAPPKRAGRSAAHPPFFSIIKKINHDPLIISSIAEQPHPPSNTTETLPRLWEHRGGSRTGGKEKLLLVIGFTANEKLNCAEHESWTGGKKRERS